MVVSLQWGSHSQAIVYDPIACGYVMFYNPAHEEPLVRYAVTASLAQPAWSAPGAVIGTEALDHDGYVGIVDPTSDGLNFERVGEAPYFFYAVTDPTDVFTRELFRQPLRIHHASPQRGTPPRVRARGSAVRAAPDRRRSPDPSGHRAVRADPRRHAAGGAPTVFLKARLNAASEA